ncbi:phosphoglycolate phosphatase [Erythrobacter sp. SG61-1L]|uniref:HAD family hydrolase n=1 Tax=Erythrobacter sp. SG61-1L TaxID=1603897 RepID=UPI0006C92DCC|nr:HAD family hydrolase [Erythrobacter sp. SG61-1L]KPL66982.1 phosphoglycolate phosphatase [Erythrobacter sp. SG61-1L]
MTTVPFAAIGFDLDGTLVDTQGDLGVAVNHALALIGRAPVPLESVESLIGGGSRLMLKRALDQTGGQIPDEEFEELYPRLIAHYAANISVHSRPYPGCLDALDRLTELGVGLAVVTNKPEALSLLLLKELDMLGRFQCVIGGDTLPRAKPHPDTVQEAMARCGGGRFAMVGDSSFDVRAAKAAGVPSVALSFGYHDIPVPELGADMVIDHYDELLPALRGL